MTQTGAGIQKKSTVLLESKVTSTQRDRGFLFYGLITANILLTGVCLILLAFNYFNFSIFGQHDELAKSSNEPKLCAVLNDVERFDCYPEDGGSEEKCLNRGCCWKPYNESQLKVPWCYFPAKYAGYKYLNITHNAKGITAFMERQSVSPYPNDVKTLKLEIEYQTDYRFRLKITDALSSRFESPYPKLHVPSNSVPQNLNYKVTISKDMSGFAVRRLNGELIFDTQDVGGFIFADQFIQISGKFCGKLFGMGEHQTRLRHDMNWTRLTLFNQDTVPVENMNLYGSHPFYLVLEPSGRSHGLFLLNSHAMDVVLQPAPAVTFRLIGGILDFYFFLGPTPSNVVEQYTELVGRPFMPPYWSLGFHLCRFGYKNVSHIEEVLNRTQIAGIPIDTQWVDIDYMVDNNDFTVDDQKFNGLSSFVDSLHKQGMHFIPILDPGVSGSEARGAYPPYDEGSKLDLFIKNENGSIFVGKVWNRQSTVFPDFTNPKTFVYWTDLIHHLHDRVSFDGLWIDMNEPSNFYDGQFDGCPTNTFDDPPFMPNVGGGRLYHKTVCMSAKQSLGAHYQLHNLYGIAEAHATSRSLLEILQKRTLVISRSTFSGIGRYAGHWSGDVASTWHDMEMTIPQMLSFSLYGVPMMGSDICGFNGNTTKYLCLRWSQLGAFYPFSRNHNTDDGVDQDPVALGEEVANAARNALSIRYSLLPYLYTLFWRAHVFGETVARPLFFEFPNDNNTHDIDSSFLWGSSLLIVPVLKEFATTVDTYLPLGRWYDWYSHNGIESNGTFCTLASGTDTIPILIRGGSILPLQEPASNTAASRLTPMTIVAAFDTNLTASGSLYWDDGDSLQTETNKNFGLINFNLSSTNMTSQIIEWGLKEAVFLGRIQVLGFVMRIKELFLNGVLTEFNWNSTNLVLTVDNLKLPLNAPLNLNWTSS